MSADLIDLQKERIIRTCQQSLKHAGSPEFIRAVAEHYMVYLALRGWQDHGREHDFGYAGCIPFSDGRELPCDTEAS